MIRPDFEDKAKHNNLDNNQIGEYTFVFNHANKYKNTYEKTYTLQLSYGSSQVLSTFGKFRSYNTINLNVNIIR